MMVRSVKSGKAKPRARHMTGVNRREQAERVREIISALPEEQRTLERVRAKLEDKGISLQEGSIYGHIKAIRQGSGGNGSGVGELERVQIVSKAVKLCGGTQGVRETLKLIEMIKGL